MEQLNFYFTYVERVLLRADMSKYNICVSVDYLDFDFVNSLFRLFYNSGHALLAPLF